MAKKSHAPKVAAGSNDKEPDIEVETVTEPKQMVQNERDESGEQRSHDHVRVKLRFEEPKKVSAKKSRGTKRARAEVKVKKKSNDGARYNGRERTNTPPMKWSNEDEIAFLEGWSDFIREVKTVQGKVDSHMYGFIKDRLSCSVTQQQMIDKKKHFGKKFRKIMSLEEPGKDSAFKSPHEEILYQLSKKIFDKEIKKDKQLEINIKIPKKNADGDCDLQIISKNMVIDGDAASTVKTSIWKNGKTVFDGLKEEDFKNMEIEQLEIVLKELAEKTKIVSDVLNEKKSKLTN